MAKARRYHAAKPKKSRERAPPRYSHYFQKLRRIKSSDTLFLWGRIRNGTFYNPFFILSIKDLLQTTSNPSCLRTGIKSTYDFIIQLRNKVPALPSIQKESDLIFSETNQIFRYNLISKKKDIYKPGIGELGEIITDAIRIGNILAQEDGQYIRVKRVTLSENNKTSDLNASNNSDSDVSNKSDLCVSNKNDTYVADGGRFSKYAGSHDPVSQPIKALQLVIDGWFKGYLEIGEPIRGIYDFIVIGKKGLSHYKDDTNIKMYKYQLKHHTIETMLRSTQDMAVGATVKAKIIDYNDGNYIVEPVNTVCMSVGW